MICSLCLGRQDRTFTEWRALCNTVLYTYGVECQLAPPSSPSSSLPLLLHLSGGGLLAGGCGDGHAEQTGRVKSSRGGHCLRMREEGSTVEEGQMAGRWDDDDVVEVGREG